MEIKLPIKLHNKYEIEVKDITTGEIIQRGYAENIILDRFFSSGYIGHNSDRHYIGSRIMFGKGTGTLAPTRTTLFQYLGYKASSGVEVVFNQTPVPSYATKKIVLTPSEYVGETITEVGIGGDPSATEIFTHALIKDSEGNPLVLGPKTNTQEITIYATVYFQPNFESGITLFGTNLASNNGLGNALLFGATCYRHTGLIYQGLDSPNLIINGAQFTGLGSGTMTHSNGVYTLIRRLQTSEVNYKIKKIGIGKTNTSAYPGGSVEVDLELLAENGSTIWGGHEFDQAPIGVGDGTTQTFNLTWDEVWDSKPKAVYVDGIEQTSGVTWASASITFDTAPADQAVITADYWVKYIPKDINHVIDPNIQIILGGGGI